MTADLPAGRRVRRRSRAGRQGTSYARDTQLRRDVGGPSETPRNGRQPVEGVVGRQGRRAPASGAWASGGTGRRAWLRAMSPQGGGGSSPPSPTKNILARRASTRRWRSCASVVGPAVDEQPDDAPAAQEHRHQVVAPAHAGRPLVSREVIVELIAAAKTHAGLKVRAELDRVAIRWASRSPTGTWPRCHCDVTTGTGWNYTVLPATAQAHGNQPCRAGTP